jgi:hypothetical protein
MPKVGLKKFPLFTGVKLLVAVMKYRNLSIAPNHKIFPGGAEV